ncbi:hypothetical protein LEMLEM_LOCUS6216 [Lemmus lemmus]
MEVACMSSRWVQPTDNRLHRSEFNNRILPFSTTGINPEAVLGDVLQKTTGVGIWRTVEPILSGSVAS